MDCNICKYDAACKDTKTHPYDKYTSIGERDGKSNTIVIQLFYITYSVINKVRRERERCGNVASMKLDDVKMTEDIENVFLLTYKIEYETTYSHFLDCIFTNAVYNTPHQYASQHPRQHQNNTVTVNSIA